MISQLTLAWRLARRELRSGFAGFFVFLACLTLGVAAIAAVGVINAGVLDSLEEDSSSLLGGDIKFVNTNFPMDEALLDSLVPIGARRGDVVRTNAMAEGVDERRVVVGLKAVDDSYPLVGDIHLDPVDMTMAMALADRGAVVERGLLARLGLDIGDPLKVGESLFTIRAVVDREPDRTDGFISIGPRVFIHLDQLAGTEVIQVGSLARYGYRFDLPEDIDAEPIIAKIRADHPESGWQVSGVRNVQPRVTRVVDRLSSYLTIAGLASLLIGGVGVALAIQNYLAGKTSTIATLKCLGAPSGLIFWTYLLQVLLLAGIGIVMGLVIGQSVPFLARELTEGLLPVEIRTGFYPLPLLLAGGCGLLTALTFAIWPLARARDISPASMFRALLTPPERWPSSGTLILLSACVLSLAGLAILGVADKILASIFVGVAIATAILLTVFARFVLMATKSIGRRGSARWRMAIANLHRPGAQATSVVVALGAGLSVLTLVVVLHQNLNAEINQSFSQRVPAVFFIDIQKQQLEAFEETVSRNASASLIQTMPTIRGRVVRINGVPASQTGIKHWTLRRDRALSYTAEMPIDTEIVAGTWWPPDYREAPLVAIEDDVAEAYNVGVGDSLGFNVLGRVIEAEIAVVRKEIDWSQGRLNAVFLMSPGVFEAAPHSYAAAVEVLEADETQLLGDMANALPNVTPISMREVSGRVIEIMGKVRLAILSVAAVTLVSGLLVLAGAVAAARRRHLRESAILKVLGAKRADLLGLFAIEYLSLGAVAAVIGAIMGMIGAYIVVTFVMLIPWVWAPLAIVQVLLIALTLTLAAGFIGTWRLLGRPAGPILRTA